MTTSNFQEVGTLPTHTKSKDGDLACNCACGSCKNGDHCGGAERSCERSIAY